MSKPKREAGLLVIVVLKAQHLHHRHEASKQDAAFVEVEITNSGKARTRADSDGEQDPLWDEEFRMTVYEVEGEPQYLHVRTMRQGNATDDELIGAAKILLDGSWTEFDEWVAIKEDGKYRGEVYLELTWYPRESPQRHASRLDPATRLSCTPANASGTETAPSIAADRLTGIDFIARDRSKDLDFTGTTSTSRPPIPPPKDPANSSIHTGRLPLPGESDKTLAASTSSLHPRPSLSLQAVTSGSHSLPLRLPTQMDQRGQINPGSTERPTASPEPIATLTPPAITFTSQGSVSLPPRPATQMPPLPPPRPTSAAPGLNPSHQSDPLIATASSSLYPTSAALVPPSVASAAPSHSPPLLGRPASARPLPAAPDGGNRPPFSPLDAKRQEAAAQQYNYEPAPPAYSPSAAAVGSSRSPSFPGTVPAPAPPDVEAEVRRSRGLMQRRCEEADRERRAAEARRCTEEEARRERIEAENVAAEERKRKSEQKRLEAIQALQRAREQRIRQEREDARIAAQMAEEAEAAERENLARRRVEDEALAKKLLAEEEAERARQQLERQRIDEDFVRQLREEDQQREDDERSAREEADAAFARRMREEEEAETRRRIEEDERIARSLAEQDRRPPAPPARSSGGARGSGRERQGP
ncbi:hypothetical protein RHOSPDRAFT_31965 [Rhodotorula sp. JG-1b]|nr:hypothetical protein RHOSPDRAFT_31965 [Rhodotorula sp. JG-1b]